MKFLSIKQIMNLPKLYIRKVVTKKLVQKRFNFLFQILLHVLRILYVISFNKGFKRYLKIIVPLLKCNYKNRSL